MKNADDGLLVLAERVGRATAEQQAEILNDAWDALGPVARWTAAQARKFGLCMDAEAYESAAIMLVPAGYIWNIYVCEDGLVQAGCEPAIPDGSDYAEVICASPALALVSAALRARYGDRGRGHG